MMRWLTKLWKILIWDDLKTIWALVTNQQARDKATRRIRYIIDEGQKIGMKNILKDYWMFYLIMIAFFFLGWGLAGMHYSAKCNEILDDRGCLILQDAQGNYVGLGSMKDMIFQREKELLALQNWSYSPNRTTERELPGLS